MTDDREPFLLYTPDGPRRVDVSGRLSSAASRLRLTREDYLRAESRGFEPMTKRRTVEQVRERVTNAWQSACDTIEGIFEELYAETKERHTLSERIRWIAESGNTADGVLVRGYVVEEIRRLGKRVEAAAAKRDRRPPLYRETDG